MYHDAAGTTISPFTCTPLDGGLFHTALAILQPHLYAYIERHRTEPLKRRTFLHQLAADDSAVHNAVKHDPGEALRYMLDHFHGGKYTTVSILDVQWVMRLRHLIYHHDPSPVLTAGNTLPMVSRLARQIQCPDVALQIEQLLADSQRLWGQLTDGIDDKHAVQGLYTTPSQIHISCLLPWNAVLAPYKQRIPERDNDSPACCKPQHQYCYVGEITAVLTVGDAQPIEPVLTIVDTDGVVANVYCTGPVAINSSDWQVGHTVALLNAGRIDISDAQPDQPKIVTVPSRQHMLSLPCKPATLRELSEDLADVLSRADGGSCSYLKCARSMSEAAMNADGQHHHCEHGQHVYYCSADCQQADLATHQRWCVTLPAYRTLMSVNYATLTSQTFADACESNIHQSLRQLYHPTDKHADCCAGWLQLS